MGKVLPWEANQCAGWWRKRFSCNLNVASTDSMGTFKCHETINLPKTWVSSVIPTLQITTQTCTQSSRKNWRLRPSGATGAPQAFLLLQKITSSCQTRKSRGCDHPALPNLFALSWCLLGHGGEERRREGWLGTGTEGACWHVSPWLGAAVTWGGFWWGGLSLGVILTAVSDGRHWLSRDHPFLLRRC